MSEQSKTPPAAGPARGSPRRWRRWWWLVALAVFVAAVQLAYEPLFGDETQATTAGDTSWPALRRCLVGDHLEKGQDPRTVLRDISFAHQSSTGTDRWPVRCAPYAQKLAATAEEDSPWSNLHSTAMTLANLETAVHAEQVALATILEPSFASLFQQADAILLGQPGDVSDVPLPPEPAKPLRDLAPLSYSSQLVAVDRTSPSMGLIFRQQPALCRLPSATGSAAGQALARCSYYADRLVAGAPQRGTTDITPSDDPKLQLVTLSGWGLSAGSHGVYSVQKGDRILPTGREIYGSFATADGHLAALTLSDERQRALVLRRPDGSTSTTPIGDQKGGQALRLIANQLLGFDHAGPQAGVLQARQLEPSADPPLGPARTVGKLVDPSWSALRDAEVCRSGKSLFVYLDGDEPQLATFDGGSWSLRSMQWPKNDYAGPRGILGCDGQAATTTRLVLEGYPALVFAHGRCAATAKSCRARIYQVEHLASMSSSQDMRTVAALGDQILMVYGGSGIRLRLAPPDELQNAPEQVIFDDDTGSGGVSVHSLRVLSHGSMGFVLIHSSQGLHVVRVAADGKVMGVGRGEG